jgi:hypothetical protein
MCSEYPAQTHRPRLTFDEPSAHFGYPVPVVGRLFDRVLALILLLRDFDRHVCEKGGHRAAGKAA